MLIYVNKLDKKKNVIRTQTNYQQTSLMNDYLVLFFDEQLL